MSKSRASVDRFERRVVFRVARAFFFVIAVSATLGCLLGAATVVLGVVPKPISAPVEPPPVPAPPPLDAVKVQAWLEAKRAEAERRDSPRTESERGNRRSNSHAPREPEVDPRRARYDALLERMKALLTDPPHPWDDVYETACAVQSPYGCLRQERRLVQQGARSAIERVAPFHRRSDEAFPRLEMLVATLGQFPVERRLELIEPLVVMFEEMNSDYLRRVEERDQQIMRSNVEYAEAKAEDAARRKQFLSAGGSAVGAGLAGIVLVSLFLAFLAMERHLRLLEAHLQSLRVESAPPTGDVV